MTRLKDKPFALIGIHVGGLDAKRLQKVMEANRLSWRSFVDEGNAGAGPIATKWNLSATPTFYLIDHQGVIQHKWLGPPAAKILEAALDKVIKTVPGA